MPVYFVRHIPSQRVKIGRAQDVWERLRMLAVGWAVLEDYELLGTLSGKDGGDIQQEAIMHGEYASLRVHGEWFKAADKLTKLLDTLGLPTPLTGLFTRKSRVDFWEGVTQYELNHAMRSRYADIGGLYARGKTMQQIAQAEGCSRQRVHQMLKLCRTRVVAWRRTHSP